MPLIKSQRIRKIPRKILYAVFIYLSAIVLFLFLVGPYLWMFISSISYERELITIPPHFFPDNPTWERYIGLITSRATSVLGETGIGFRRAFMNSIIVASVATIIIITLSSLAAYATRFSFQGRNLFMFLILITQMISRSAIIIPIYLIMGYLGLKDKRIGLIIIYIGFLLPIAIWILRNYFMTIPKEISEAAVIDGCSHINVLIKIILPMVSPGLFATGIYVFLSAWNEFFFALILTSTNAKTITVAITEFSTQGGIDYGMMTTAGIIGSIVPLILAIIFQKYLIKGLTAGWGK